MGRMATPIRSRPRPRDVAAGWRPRSDRGRVPEMWRPMGRMATPIRSRPRPRDVATNGPCGDPDQIEAASQRCGDQWAVWRPRSDRGRVPEMWRPYGDPDQIEAASQRCGDRWAVWRPRSDRGRVPEMW